MKKRIISLVLVAIMALSLVACAAKEQTTPDADTQKTDDKYIAMVALGFGHQFWQAVKQGAEEVAAENGYRITFEGPEAETMVDKQIDMLKTALANHPEAVCMAAIDTEAVASILQEAKSKGIPVVGFDAGVGEAEADSACATDNLAAGAMAAEHAAELLGSKGKVAIIGHHLTTIDAVQRVEGFKEKLKEYPNMEVVDFQCGDGDHLKSAEIAKSMVTAHPDIDLIYTSNEGSCVGAYNGLKEIGKIGEVKLIGFDSSAALKDAVRKGEVSGAITQDPIGMGRKTIEVAIKLINGEEVEDYYDTGCRWYDASNMDDPDIAPLLYD